MDMLPGQDTARPRRRWRMIAAIAVVVVIALVAAAMLFGGSRAKQDGKAPVAATGEAKGKRNAQVPTVTVSVPGRQTIGRTISATGSLAARREMPVGVAGEGGLVTRVLVEPGSWVAAGQVLATVDRSVQTQTAASIAANVRVAQADARIAQSELSRAQQLVARGFISRADIERKTATRDAAAARVRVAQAQLAEARARNGRLDIRSPAAGLVLTRQVEPGQIVSPGSGTLFRVAMGGQMELRAQIGLGKLCAQLHLFRVAMGGQMELRAQLAEADLLATTVGSRAQVTPVGSTRVFDGEVWQVAPVIDPQTRQGIARVALSYDRALRPGGFASVTINTGATVAPLLPESAVQSDTRGNFVYIVNARNQVERRDVTTGVVSDAGVAIASGLAGNERVVMRAGAFLNPGQTVRPNLVRMER